MNDPEPKGFGFFFGLKEFSMNGGVKTLDCSIRDGGLMNKWQFDDTFVAQSIEASQRSGLDYIEVGYKADPGMFDPKEYGKWRFCKEEDLRQVWAAGTGAVLTVMIDIGRFKIDSLGPKSASVVGAYRVACYVHQIDEAIETCSILDMLGYETFLNIMAVSEADPVELERALLLAEMYCPATAVYVVDSYGNLSPETTKHLISMYKTLCPSKDIGFHGHNNQQLALANTLAAMEAGATYLDASLYGMGRGAGNCPLELLLTQLGRSIKTVSPLFEVIDRHLMRMKEELKWGYHLPYAISGLANKHPKEAMALMDESASVIETGFLERAIQAS